MRGYRKKNVFNSVERVIKKMLPDVPLTMNLKNQEYMQIILAGKKTLEERFAEVDSESGPLWSEEIKNRNKYDASRDKEDYQNPELNGFGLMLVKMLVGQLDGSFSIENHGGVKTIIKFSL